MLKHLLYKYGLPAMQNILANMANYDKLSQFPGNAGREMSLMHELARQHGMGLPENRVTVPHTAGASEQFVLSRGMVTQSHTGRVKRERYSDILAKGS
eukprot:COSAG02_NODE_106_length_36326_cov_13.777266_18_plen_98_part_00